MVRRRCLRLGFDEIALTIWRGIIESHSGRACTARDKEQGGSKRLITLSLVNDLNRVFEFRLRADSPSRVHERLDFVQYRHRSLHA